METLILGCEIHSVILVCDREFGKLTYLRENFVRGGVRKIHGDNSVVFWGGVMGFDIGGQAYVFEYFCNGFVAEAHRHALFGLFRSYGKGGDIEGDGAQKRGENEVFHGVVSFFGCASEGVGLFNNTHGFYSINRKVRDPLMKSHRGCCGKP